MESGEGLRTSLEDWSGDYLAARNRRDIALSGHNEALTTYREQLRSLENQPIRASYSFRFVSQNRVLTDLLIPVERNNVLVSISTIYDTSVKVRLVNEDGSLHSFEERVEIEDLHITPFESEPTQ